MSDQIKISFTPDGTLELDISRLDEELLRKLLQRGRFRGAGNTVQVESLGAYPWPAPNPIDADCLCPLPLKDPPPIPPRMNIQCYCDAGSDVRDVPSDFDQKREG